MRMYIYVFLFIFVFFTARSVLAAALETEETPRSVALQQAFSAMMADPGNTRLTILYVDAATAAGDLEGAIGALSRLLLANPDLPAIHLRLAALYHALHSNGMAELHYRQALSLPLDPPQRQEAEHGLIELAASANPISGLVQLGVTRQSNATAGPDSQARIGGTEVTPQGKFAARPDWNSFLYASLNHSLDFDDSAGTRWDTALSLYATLQQHAAYENLTYGKLTSGPTWLVGETPAETLHLYAVAEVLGWGNAPFSTTGGIGAAWETPIDPDITSRLELEALDRSYDNRATYPTATDENGGTAIARYILSYRWQPGDVAIIRLQATDDIAQKSDWRYREWRVVPTMVHNFTGLWGADSSWQFALELQWAWRPYAGPNPTIDPAITRSDRERSAGIQLQLPIAEGLSSRTAASYLQEDSTVENFRYTNWVMATSLQLVF